MSAEHAVRVFDLSGGHPALDLVNTLDWRFREGEPEELLAGWDDLVAFVEQNGLIAAKQARLLRRAANGEAERVLRETRELREALSAALYAQLDEGGPTAAQLSNLEEILKPARRHERLQWTGTHAEWQPDAREGAAMPFRLLARKVDELVTSPDLEQVRACGDPRCRWLFLDLSKNHSRVWCNMKVCGNRMKARRFKAQHG